MELTEQQKEFRNAFQKAIETAWDNEEFKSELIKNPAQAIEKETGTPLNLKPGVKIIVADQSDPDTIYLNIPEKINFDDMELSEKELEDVAGGFWWARFGFSWNSYHGGSAFERATSGWTHNQT